MHKQKKKIETPQKVMVRYLNGPTESYQCEDVFSIGLTASVSQETADELLLKHYHGKKMFVQA